MPLLSRWCVRCALAYLIIGMGIGSWMLIQQSRGHAAGAPWRALHAHLLLVGFFLLLVMGVAHWMFPRVSGTRPGRTGGWIAFWLVNAGLLLRVLAEPMVDHGHGTPWTWVLEAAAVLPTIGIAAFSITILPRVRAAIDPETARALRARVKD